MPMPKYLYHATPNRNAQMIANNGLEPRSGNNKYLCMSAREKGARTLGGRANDIIFRVESTNLNSAQWTASGVGDREWRSTTRIEPRFLEYRRNLGTPFQRTWRPATDYRAGSV